MSPADRRQDSRSLKLKPTHITLKNQQFRVNDISNNGIGIVLLDHHPKFFIGERIEKIPISPSSGTITVSGTVTHLSVSSAGTICGILFSLTGNQFKAVVRFRKERTAQI